MAQHLIIVKYVEIKKVQLFHLGLLTYHLKSKGMFLCDAELAEYNRVCDMRTKKR